MSESRNSSESREESYYNNYSTPNYNALEGIDELIRKFESQNIELKSSNSSAVQRELSKRTKMISELKQLRIEAEQRCKEVQDLALINRSNNEIAETLSYVKNLVRKQHPATESSYYSGPSWDDGESRNGESNW